MNRKLLTAVEEQRTTRSLADDEAPAAVGNA
jgi:hypothetical protein